MENEADQIPQKWFTTRECEIVELRSQGLRNKDVAVKLSISVKTVEVHMHNLLRKYCQAGNVCGLCCMFLRNGWIK